MRILFTGISSFTGYWFARALAGAGHEVTGTLSGQLETYEGLRRRRSELASAFGRLAPETPFGSEAFLSLVRDGGPWDLLCHHAADVTNYKSPDFDVQRALKSNTCNLPQVITVLKSAKAKGIVLTGTVFENNEGAGTEPLRAFSPYGLSKALTWQAFRQQCGLAELPLGKFVIPNPFGPWEELRFTAYLMKAWKQRQTATVKTPDYVRDNIHADLLSAVYAQFAVRVAADASECRINPSGYVETQGAFATRVAREVKARTGWPCALELPAQTDFSEPLKRINLRPAAPLVPAWSERAAWDAFVEFYLAVDSPAKHC